MNARIFEIKKMLRLGIIATHQEKINPIESFKDLFSINIIDLDLFDPETIGMDAFYIHFDSNVFELICILIKKRYPIFLDFFFKANTEQANTLLQLSHEAETFVQIYSPLKYRQFNDSLNNSFNNPRYISIHRKINNHNTEILMQNLFFEVDFITSKLNAQIKKIQSIYIPQNSKNIHTIESRLEFNNGTIFHVFLTLLSEIEGYQIKLVKNESYFEIDIIHQTIESSSEKTTNKLSIEDYNNEELLFLEQIKEFQHAILHNKHPLSDLESALPTLEICKEIIAKLVYS